MMIRALIGSLLLCCSLTTTAPASPATQPTGLSSAQKRVQEGQQLAQAGDHAAALLKYEEALRLDAASAEAHASKAASLLALKQPQQAEKEIDAALKLNHRNGGFHVIAGRVQVELGAFGKAKEAYDSAARLAPKQAGAFYADYASVLAAQGNVKLNSQIEAALKQAVSADPPHVDSLFTLGQSYAKVGRPDGLIYLRRYLEAVNKLPEPQRDPTKLRLARQMVRALEIAQEASR